MKKRLKKKWYVVLVNRHMVYEPAEGGYYVPEFHIVDTLTYKSKKHAYRDYKYLVNYYNKENTFWYSEPKTNKSNTETVWEGTDDSVIIAFTNTPEVYEHRYNGYC